MTGATSCRSVLLLGLSAGLLITATAACASPTAGGLTPTASGPQSGSPNVSAHPSAPTSAPPPTPSSAESSNSACVGLPAGRYAIPTYGVAFDCPAGFDHQAFARPPDTTILYAGRVWSPERVGSSGYPEGQVEISVSVFDASDLRQWLAKHIGAPQSATPGHYWDSTSHVEDGVVAGRPSVNFDYVLTAPEAPPMTHATAIDIGNGHILRLDAWSYSDTYRPTIYGVLATMIASVTLSS
jgi:hypothetical protein